MTDQHTLKTALSRAERELGAAGVPAPDVDARLLAAHVLGISRGELAAHLITAGDTRGTFDFTRFFHLVSERARRIPVQHLTGTAFFRHLELAVGPGVFIPRPETEEVTQVALDELARRRRENPHEPLIAVDLCTGSGAIALALATESTANEVHAVEISQYAFAWAQKNRERVALARAANSSSSLEHLYLHREDATAFEALQDLDGQVDVVATNPPYIPPDQAPVDPEVAEHDPEVALFGRGADGLKIPCGVLNRAQKLLKPGGVLVLEHAEVQADSLRKIARASGWQNVETRTDLAGKPRMLYATSPRSQSEMEE